MSNGDIWRTEITLTGRMVGEWHEATNNHNGNRVLMSNKFEFYYPLEDKIFDRNGRMMTITEDVVHYSTDNRLTLPPPPKSVLKKTRAPYTFPSKYEAKLEPYSKEEKQALVHTINSASGAVMRKASIDRQKRAEEYERLLKGLKGGVLYVSVGDLKKKTYSGQIQYDRETGEPIFIHLVFDKDDETGLIVHSFFVGPIDMDYTEEDKIMKGTRAVSKLMEMDGNPVEEQISKKTNLRAYDVMFGHLEGGNAASVNAINPWPFRKEVMSNKGCKSTEPKNKRKRSLDRGESTDGEDATSDEDDVIVLSKKPKNASSDLGKRFEEVVRGMESNGNVGKLIELLQKVSSTSNQDDGDDEVFE